jgi:hypothetical protein
MSSDGVSQPRSGPSSVAAQFPVAARQAELFPLSTLVELPGVMNGADVWGSVIASDGQRYVAKADRGREPVRASEWLGTHLAEAVNIACATPKVIQLQDGELAFGSRAISGAHDAPVTSAILTTQTAGPQGNAVPGLPGFLSSVYAFDMFTRNIDRHDQNYISFDDSGNRRFVPIDFSRSLVWHDNGLTGFPLATQRTRRTFAILRQLHGFDLSAARATLERLAGVTTAQIASIMKLMPAEWLSQERCAAFLTWWDPPARQERLAALRTGFEDGTLL